MHYSQNLENVIFTYITVYSWGNIQIKSANIYTQAKPKMQDSTNIINFSCGYSHTLALDSLGSAYAMGSN